MVTTHCKNHNTNSNETKDVLKGWVALVRNKVAVANEAFRLRGDCDKIKADAAKMMGDATKMKAKLKLRKQAMKEVKHEDNILMMDTLMMSLVDVEFYEEKKKTIILKRFGHSSSTE